MKVFTDKPRFSPINIIIETEDELVTLKAALELAVKETDVTFIPGIFFPILIPERPRNAKYRKMLNYLTM